MLSQRTRFTSNRKNAGRAAVTIISVFIGSAALGADDLNLPDESGKEDRVHAKRDSAWLLTAGLEGGGTVNKYRGVATGAQRAPLSNKRFSVLTALAKEQIDNGSPVSAALLVLEAFSDATKKERARAGDGQWVRAVATLEAGLRANRERAVLTGHEGVVYGVALSPDGRWFVTGSADNTARIWDSETGETRAVLRGHEGRVRSIAVSPDGAWIVTGSWDFTARIWDSKTGEERISLKGHRGNVLSVAVSPDGAQILTGSGDNTIRIWDSKTGEELSVLAGHEGSVSSIAVSPDGTWFVTGSDDKTARIWDAGTGRVLAVLKGHEGAVHSVAISPHGARRIATGSSDNTVRIWNSKTGEELSLIEGHQGGVWSVAVSPDGRWIVSGAGDNHVRIWEAQTGAARAVLKGHEGAVYSIAVSPDGARIVTASSDKTVRIWDAKAGEELFVLRGHQDDIYRVAMSSDGTRIITGSDDHTVRIWDAKTGEELTVLKNHEDGVSSIALSSDGQRIVTGSADKSARVWDAKSGDELVVLDGHTRAVKAVAMSPDGAWVVTASWDKTARIWDANTGEERAVLRGHADSVTTVAVSPDGARIVTGSRDGTARIWDANTGNVLSVLESGAVYSLSVSSDGTRIVTGSWDKTARIWDAETGKELALLRGHKEAVYDVAVSPDGSWVVTGAGDNVARIWDAKTGEERAVLKGHERPVHSVAVSPDGARIVTGSWDKTARIWDARTGKELAVLRGHEGAIYEVAVSPDGARIVTVSTDNTARIWRNVPTSADDLMTHARTVVPRCLTSTQRAKLGIGPKPPRWCHTMRKWPYDPFSKYLRAKDHLMAGREEAATTAFADALAQIPSLKDQVAAAWGARLAAAGDRHFAAKENGPAIEAYTRFLFAAEGKAALQEKMSLAILRRGIAYYRQKTYRLAMSDFRRAARLGQKTAGNWLWTAINGAADALFANGETAPALLEMLSNYRRLTVEDRQYIRSVELKTSLWRLSYGVSRLFTEIGSQVRFNSSAQQNQCDILTAHFNDPFKVATGVQFEKITFEAAISACTKLIETSPDEPRLYLQRARAYAKAKQYDKERSDLEVAMGKGYPMAFNNMGYAYLSGNGVEKSIEKGADLYLETLNRIVRCCGAPVAEHLLSLRNREKHLAGDLHAAAHMLLNWSASLGDPSAHELLAAFYIEGESSVGDRDDDARLSAYYHLGLAEKLYFSEAKNHRADRAAENADALARELPGAKIKSLDEPINDWQEAPFTAVPPWILK